MTILENDFQYKEKHYGSLSAIAHRGTGTRWNGFRFFGLNAIYTRKSTAEGLEQEFNTLQAQREAAEASVKSRTAGMRTPATARRHPSPPTRLLSERARRRASELAKDSDLPLRAPQSFWQMLGMLFKMAHSGRHPAMTMFWLKTRGGWSEKGNPQEAIEPDRGARWVVQVYQPPRSPEPHKGLGAAMQGVQEASEWEEFSRQPRVMS